MKAGFGISCINPALGMPMEGLGQQGGIERIHDDLFARALWFEQDGQKIVIVSLDLLFFEREVTDRLRGAVARLFDLKVNEVLLNFTHTHAGPRCSEWHYSGKADPIYLNKVQHLIVAAVAQAAKGLESVECRAGATTTELPVSRRRINAKGIAEFAPSPESEVCSHLPFAVFSNPKRDVKALLFSAACHPSMIYGLEVSAEWPGAAVRRLNDYFRTSGSVFLQGAGADAKPRQIATETQWRHDGTWEEMEAAGKEVADALIKASVGELRGIKPHIRVVAQETFWPLEPVPSREWFETLRKDPQSSANRQSWARDMLGRLDLFGKLPEEVPMIMHGVQFGEGLRLLALECELVGELGNLILREYPDGVTFPLGYSNGCALYLPSDRQLPQHGYEVDSFWEYHWPSALAGGIDERLRNCVRSLRERGIS